VGSPDSALLGRSQRKSRSRAGHSGPGRRPLRLYRVDPYALAGNGSVKRKADLRGRCCLEPQEAKEGSGQFITFGSVIFCGDRVCLVEQNLSPTFQGEGTALLERLFAELQPLTVGVSSHDAKPGDWVIRRTESVQISLLEKTTDAGGKFQRVEIQIGNGGLAIEEHSFKGDKQVTLSRFLTNVRPAASKQK
jgi:hypothetical protein